MNRPNIAQLLRRVALCVVVFGAASRARAGVFDIFPISTDADIGVSSANTYTHAIDFAGPGTRMINGVTFLAGGPGVFPGGSNNIPNVIGSNNIPPYVTGGTREVLTDFIWGNPAAVVQLDGLIVGNEYDTRFYHRNWDGGGFYNRTQLVGADVNLDSVADDTIMFNEEDSVGHLGPGTDPLQPMLLSYRFTAQATSVRFTFNAMNPDTATYHLYALTNEGFGTPPPPPPPIPSTRIPGLFNTGVDDTGVPLPDNVDDPHYNLLGVDIYGPGNVVPDATVPPGFPIPPWVANSATSRWIGPATPIADGENGHYYYEILFDMTGLRPETAIIRGAWSTDNGGVEILLNGVPTGNQNIAQFGSLTPFEIAGYLGDQFVDGLNSLIFVVYNEPFVNDPMVPGDNPTGLRVELLAGAEPIPEPSTVALAGLAITLLVAGRIRRFNRR